MDARSLAQQYARDRKRYASNMRSAFMGNNCPGLLFRRRPESMPPLSKSIANDYCLR